MAYINDFVREGRILRVQMQAEAETRSARRRTSCGCRCATRRAAWCRWPKSPRRRWVAGTPKLDRYNGLPSMKISGNPAPGRSTGEAMAAMEEVAQKLPPGFGFEWSGTSYEERLSGSQAPFLFAVSLIVVFLCLAALYESWSIPFAVMLVVPLGIFGAVLAVSLRGLPNDVYFKVGPDRHHRPVGEERDPDHRVCARAAGPGHGPDRGHAGSLPPALPADPDDLDRLYRSACCRWPFPPARAPTAATPSAPA